MNDFSLQESTIREQALIDQVEKFSVGVGIFKDNQILIVKRAKDDFLGGYWEIPGGQVDENESFASAAVRETMEEVGLTVIELDYLHTAFDYEGGSGMVRQVNFLVEVANLNVRLSSEHDDYSWISVDEIDKSQTTTSMKNCIIKLFSEKNSSSNSL